MPATVKMVVVELSMAEDGETEEATDAKEILATISPPSEASSLRFDTPSVTVTVAGAVESVRAWGQTIWNDMTVSARWAGEGGEAVNEATDPAAPSSIVHV